MDAAYLFNKGENYMSYKFLGAHPYEDENGKGFIFRVWAPHARMVSVMGDFNDWNPNDCQMFMLGKTGIWEQKVPGAQQWDRYKYRVVGADNRIYEKGDPYARHFETRPNNASIIYDPEDYIWNDDEFCRKRKDALAPKPINIYEIHLGSWRRHPDGNFFSYRELAIDLSDYCKKMNYTHIELMPILEHPLDDSWGYQVTGYYAPTSRYGEPTEFMYLVNALHRNGIGVILDWVPAHFCPDEFGLSCFDGTCIYEHPDPRKGEHPDWGTKIFNLEKPEVKNFLIANALFWIRKFHIDGLRVDAVASMLYLDYGKKDGQWVANKYGDNKNLEAIEFFKHFNSVVRGSYPEVLTIAEESTAWPKVTARPEDDGLGFAFKWNMGWMHDFCEYMKLDPYFRQGAHYMLTFAMSYNDSENYILPLSHDEVVHLKCSMVEKMPGYQVDKYANLRAGYTYMFGHSGKKLLFMGQDFGQEREWSEKRELDWFLLENDLNRGMKEYVGKLLELYRKYPAFYEVDNDWGGFEWINADDKGRSTYSFYRRAANGKDNILFVLNMTPVERKGFMVGVPYEGTYTHLLDSAEKQFGGMGSNIPAKIKSIKGLCDYKDYSLTFDLPPYGAEIFLFQTPKLKKKKS
jgi:1,4-alpha-glucan branching enzyme